MSDEKREYGQQGPRCEHSDPAFFWPLGKDSTPDEMNTSYGPRIDADRWDFPDGIDLFAPVGTPVHAWRMAWCIVPGRRIRRGDARAWEGLASRQQACTAESGTEVWYRRRARAEMT